MSSRVEKYSNIQEHKTRTDKNKNIYENVGTIELNQIIDVEPLIERKNFKLESLKEEETEDRTSNIIEPISNIEDKEKEYDINIIIEKAKENRVNNKIEERKKLKKEEYNVTNTIDIEKENITGIKEEDSEEIKELINTIYSNNLKEEIEKAQEENEGTDLFSDLMSNNEDDKVDSANNLEKTKEITGKIGEETSLNLEVNKAINDVSKENKKQENTFFTKSLEFEQGDLIDDDDDDFYNTKKGSKKIIPIMLVIFTLIIIGLICYVYFFK